MTGDYDARFDRLVEALEAYCLRRQNPEGEGEDEFLRRHAEVRDLLHPMLQSGAAHGPEVPASMMASVPAGRILGDFRLGRELGRGGMGIVYEAEQISLARRVALKILPVSLTLSATRVERFRREAEAAARLRHPNIVSVYAVGEEKGLHFYAMECVEGESLASLIDRRRRALPTTRSDIVEVANLGLRMAEALAYAHDNGVIHRDIKPSNILIDDTGIPLVTDFGLAKREGADGLSMSGQMLGTTDYMSPEQASGTPSEIDARTDIYSLGVTLYEMLTRKRPFEGGTAPQVIRRILVQEPRRLRKRNPYVPRDLETIVLTAMAKDPARRYPRATELAADLRRFLELRPIRARPGTPLTRGMRFVRRNPAKSASIVLSALVGIGGPILFGLQQMSAKDAIQAERDAKEALYLSAKSELLLRLDPSLGLLLAVEGYRRSPAPESSSALYSAWSAFVKPFAQRLRLEGHEAKITSVCFSPDGQRILSASEDKTARLWDADRGTLLITLRGHQGPVTSATFDRDGHRILTTSYDGIARIWDASGRTLVTLTGTRARVYSGDFSPVDDRVVTGFDDGTARLWNAATGEELVRLEGDQGPILSVSFAPDGSRVLTGSGDGTARIWDTNSGQLLMGLKQPGPISAATFSPDGERVVTAGGLFHLRLWDVDRGTQIAELSGHHREICSTVFSPKGDWLLSASTDGTARVWDAVNFSEIAILEHREPPSSVAFSPDGAFIVTGDREGSVHVRSVSGGNRRYRFLGHADRVSWASFRPGDTGHLVTASFDGTVRLWNPSPSCDSTILAHGQDEYFTADFNSDATRLVTTCRQGGTRIWDVANQRALRTLGGAHRVHSAFFSPDDRYIVTASRDGTARIWNVETGENTVTLRGHRQRVNSALFSSDGAQVVTAGDDQTARIWEAKTGASLATLEHRKPVTFAVFSPDGSRVATAVEDMTARLWDAKTGELLRAFRGHERPLRCVAFDPTGSRIATASLDRTVRLWKTATGKPLATYQEHTGGVNCVHFGPDGDWVLSTSDDGTAQVWPADPLPEALELKPRELTFDERARYGLLHRKEWEARTETMRARHKAERIVNDLREELVLYDAVKARIESDGTFTSGIRRAALEILRVRWDDLIQLNEANWQAVRAPNQPLESYERARHRSEAVCQAEPDNRNYLTTLAVAQYRTRSYESARRTLTRLDRLDGPLTSLVVSTTFTAMTLHQLERAHDARKKLQQVKLLMKDLDARDREELRDVIAEAKVLIE